jgi:hypothetical protein
VGVLIREEPQAIQMLFGLLPACTVDTQQRVTTLLLNIFEHNAPNKSLLCAADGMLSFLELARGAEGLLQSHYFRLAASLGLHTVTLEQSKFLFRQAYQRPPSTAAARDREFHMETLCLIGRLSERVQPLSFVNFDGVSGAHLVARIDGRFPSPKVGFAFSCWLKLTHFLSDEVGFLSFRDSNNRAIYELFFKRVPKKAQSMESSPANSMSEFPRPNKPHRQSFEQLPSSSSSSSSSSTTSTALSSITTMNTTTGSSSVAATVVGNSDTSANNSGVNANVNQVAGGSTSSFNASTSSSNSSSPSNTMRGSTITSAILNATNSVRREKKKEGDNFRLYLSISSLYLSFSLLLIIVLLWRVRLSIRLFRRRLPFWTTRRSMNHRVGVTSLSLTSAARCVCSSTAS